MVDARSGLSTSPYTQEQQEKMAALVRENKERKELLKQAKLKAIAEEQATKMKKLAEEMKRVQQEEEERRKAAEEEAAAEEEKQVLCAPGREDALAQELATMEDPLQRQEREEERKLEWKLRMKREKKRRRDDVNRLTAEVAKVKDCRQEVEAKADGSAKMDKVLGYLEVLSAAWMEERQANRAQEVALKAMRSGFRDFGREMATHVGGEVRRLRDNVGKFCEGAIDSAKAVAAVESEARPRPCLASCPETARVSVSLGTSFTGVAEELKERMPAWAKMKKESKGQLILVDVEVFRSRVGALIDSGATRSYISRRALKKLRLGLKVQKLADPIVSVLADNRTMRVEDYIEGVQAYFHLEKDGKVEKVLHSLTVLVQDDLPFDMVLGMDWGEAAGGTLHLREHECRLPSPLDQRERDLMLEEKRAELHAKMLAAKLQELDERKRLQVEGTRLHRELQEQKDKQAATEEKLALLTETVLHTKQELEAMNKTLQKVESHQYEFEGVWNTFLQKSAKDVDMHIQSYIAKLDNHITQTFTPAVIEKIIQGSGAGGGGGGDGDGDGGDGDKKGKGVLREDSGDAKKIKVKVSWTYTGKREESVLHWIAAVESYVYGQRIPYWDRVLMATSCMAGDAMSFAISLQKEANCQTMIEYSQQTRIEDFFKVVRERFEDKNLARRTEMLILNIADRKWKSVSALKATMDELLQCAEHGLTQLYPRTKEEGMTYEKFSKIAIDHAGFLVEANYCHYWKDLQAGKKWQNHTISGNIPGKDNLLLTFEGGVETLSYDQID
ncbi:hypothetical protein CBR_g28858 [Chara braunii]|uniref:Uncharacterized protein n=1 Tax=Chara braunii TaxID=69332 RepID=A0A388LAC9_CHABU|nr:hypothetical protein CBR_g28858 [Chara braunii]|eukprot:GBG79143.1 hypothetical protein CBR_g28858 [Chara braunii]